MSQALMNLNLLDLIEDAVLVLHGMLDSHRCLAGQATAWFGSMKAAIRAGSCALAVCC
jgi:hypothetical protein